MKRRFTEAAGGLLVAAMMVTTSAIPARSQCEPGECGPGPFWIDGCFPGTDNMQTEALVGLDLNQPLDGIADVSLIMGGPTIVVREAESGGSIPTEIVSMSLTGGGYTLTAGLQQGTCTPALMHPSLGSIIQTSMPELGESFFDVFFEVRLPSGMCLWNHEALRIDGLIDRVPPCGDYLHPTGIVPLYDQPDTPAVHVANLVSARHRVFTPQQHYQTYWVDSPVTNGDTLQVADQFYPDSLTIQMVSLERLLVPVRKNHGEITDPEAHLTWWSINVFAPRDTHYVRVENQFHPPARRANWILDGPDFLLAPAGKDLQPGPPFPPIPTTVDHYLCYRARTADPPDTVRLEDQFNLPEYLDVKALQYLCAPCAKMHDGQFYPVLDDLRHLALYRIRPPFFETGVDIADQFRIGPAVLRRDPVAHPIEYLVVPTGKRERSDLVDVGSIDERELPFILLPPVPNPTTGRTTIQFNLPRESEVELGVYDVSGRRVRELVSKSVPAGRHLLTWDGLSDASEAVVNGVYFVKLTWDGGTSSQRVVIMR
jgi:hypothetical protein